MPSVTVNWSSNATDIVTVDGTGLVTAVANGVATIVATSGSLSGSATVTVDQVATGTVIEPEYLTLYAVGDTATLAATVIDANGHAIQGTEVTWESEDPSIVTIDSAGLVTAVQLGTTAVTATAGEIMGSAVVAVEQVAHSISVEPTNLRFTALGDTARVFATVLDANGNRADAVTVYWTSADSTVVAVVHGWVLAVGPGTTTVTAISGSVSATVDVEVVQAPVTVLINPESLAFAAVGDTAKLAAIVVDANGTDIPSAPLEWSVTDPSVASVNSGGLVTATGIGSTAVTATSDSVSGSVSVRVFDVSSDRGVLEYLFHAMGGAGWTNSTGWLSDEPLSHWFGIGTDLEGRVNKLALRNNNLTGQIPAAIENLDRAFLLDLSENHLTGTIPAEIGNMNVVRDLVLGHNPLEGQIPPELGGMERLSYLYLANTNLFGPVPETFANLRLNAFYFHSTLLCLPQSLKSWLTAIPSRSEGDDLLCVPVTADRAALIKLYEATGGENWERSENWLSEIGINKWEGVEVNEDGYVTSLFLSHNNLTDAIPPEVGDLAHLEVLYLQANELTGEIPPSLGRLTRLRVFYLAANELRGNIPVTFGNLTSLDTLDFSSNELVGSIPPGLGNLSGLKRLALYNNRLTGPLPAELGKLTDLRDIWFADNQLEGSLPPELGQLRSLESLNLLRNRISGPIPATFGNLTSLQYLSLSENELTGDIPGELGNLGALQRLYLSDNELTGHVPRELGNLESLELLWLFLNDLGGSIPPELGELDNLESMALGQNDLTGHIPPEIGQLTSLSDLHLGANRLSGGVPPELGNLSSLRHLHLFENNLAGPLPTEIANLGTLETLSVVYNEGLTGLVPRELMGLESLTQLHFHNTGLCAHIDDEFQEWLDALPDVDVSHCPVGTVERFALTDLFDRTGGNSWTVRDGWKSTGPLSNWVGLRVAGGRVRELSLPDNGLAGPLIPEIANLTELEVLDLSDNDLEGEFPGALTTQTKLVALRVGGNEGLTGVLPFGMTRLRSLEVLDFSGTDLCASPSATFQAWFTDIDDASGTICGNRDQVRLSVPIVYLTQSVQSPSRSVRLVADRDALLRVFVTSDQSQSFFEPAVRATLTRYGRETYSVTMTRAADQLMTVADESDLGFSYNAVIPGDHIVPGAEMVVEVDPEEVVPRAPGSVVRFPESGALPLNVVRVPPMLVTVVPVLEAESPDSSIFAWTDGLSGNSPQVGLFKYAFPFADFRAKSRETYVTSLDLTSESGQWGLVLEMEALRAADEGTGYYYGAASSVNGYVRGKAKLSSWVSIGKAWDTELAHEVGHSLSLLHAPCGGALGVEPEFPYPDGSVGVWGYDFRDGSLVSPARHRDIMGYCYEKGWLSDFYFERVIDYRERYEAHAKDAAADPSDVIVLWGGVVEGEMRLEPVFSMRAVPSLPEEPGAYRLEGVGTDGHVELSLDFTPGEDKFGNKYFFFTVPVDPGWGESLERITLTGPEGVVTAGSDDPRRVSVVTDRSTGQIRGILRDWDGALPMSLGAGTDLNVQTTSGVRQAIRVRSNPPGGEPDVR